MNLASLKPASEFAKQYGCKAIVYGPPGSRKTPLINTCPRPLMLACEPGMLSMRGSSVPTFQAFTGAKIDEFFKWFFESNERKDFDTLAIDSVSQMADIYLQEALRTNKHGKAAYGDMATKVKDHMRKVFFSENVHTYLIAKEGDNNGVKWPHFPGQVLVSELPGWYDFILHLNIQNVPGMGNVSAFRCNQAVDVLARNRTGNLNDYEPPDFGALIRKAMS